MSNEQKTLIIIFIALALVYAGYKLREEKEMPQVQLTNNGQISIKVEQQKEKQNLKRVLSKLLGWSLKIMPWLKA